MGRVGASVDVELNSSSPSSSVDFIFISNSILKCILASSYHQHDPHHYHFLSLASLHFFGFLLLHYTSVFFDGQNQQAGALSN